MTTVRRLRNAKASRGQAMVELALIFPLFIMLFVGIITLGIGVFYQQQLTNAAREAARFAAIHSATALCPTASTLDPAGGALAAYKPLSYADCDSPDDSWPAMTAAGRSLVFGLDSSNVNVAACWSGYRDVATNAYDAPPDGLTVDIAGLPYTYDTAWAQCTIDGEDPTSNPSGIGCTTTLSTTTVDEASNMSEGTGKPVANSVTAYACYEWSPPMAGFLLIPETVTLRAVITEPIERQQ
jgi:Flp pilus assembly protein TadG